ncbi:hypothetical protein [Marinobacter sp.]|uniref:hypothetical protein n=1 Tax=Marinobacter sp. TaxID=50741 RepID=UPI003A947DD2
MLSIAWVTLGFALVYAAAQFEFQWAVYFSAFAFCIAVVEFLFFAISKTEHYSSQIFEAKASSLTMAFSWRRAISFLFAGLFFISMIGSQVGGAAVSAIFYGIAFMASWAPSGKKRWCSLPTKFAVVATATVLALYCQPDTLNFNQ